MKENDLNEFEKNIDFFVNFIVNYYKNIENFPVKSQINPKEIYNLIESIAPEYGTSLKDILDEFENNILSGITHWQSPNFFAYFNANTSIPSILGEFITAALGVNVFSWETSPAGTELEQKIMEWLREMIGLPDYFTGVIQDTASTSTLISIITAREKFSNFEINNNGFSKLYNFRIYCSKEAHSSIEKDSIIAGIGSNNLIKINTNDDYSINTQELENAIIKDLESDFTPLCVISAIGTTSSTAIDNIKEVGIICKKYDLWHHVDAAHLGSALICEEYRHWIEGIENVDTFVFNPHKWLFTNFDFSAYFVKSKDLLIKTFEIMPEYLRINVDNVVNYKDWGIQLGRRFRALKMWFVIKYYGTKKLKEIIRYHINLAKYFEDKLKECKDFEILAPRTANLVCFRALPINSKIDVNEYNLNYLNLINTSGKAYLTKTMLNNKITLRVNVGQTYVNENNVENLLNLLLSIKRKLDLVDPEGLEPPTRGL